MGGANLEVWKFGFYTLFPLATLYYFSDDDWYNKHVVPYGRKIWPEYEKTNRPPHTQQEIQAELARMKASRQSISSSSSAGSAGIEAEPNVSTLSHEMRAAASSGIFGMGSTSSTPTSTSTSTPAEVPAGLGSSAGTTTNGAAWTAEEASNGRIGARVGGWREADRERLV